MPKEGEEISILAPIPLIFEVVPTVITFNQLLSLGVF